MTPDDIPDEDLLYIVGQADKELCQAGIDIKHRILEVPRLVMKRFGYPGYVIAGRGKPKILERIDRAFASIYRKQDLAVGGHIGVFMYRDIFARIAVPHVFGTVSINPFECIDLTPVQLRIIQSEPEEMEVLIDQFSDVADIQYGTQEIKSTFAKIELVSRFIGLARLHLHAASAVLTGGYDYRGAVQSSLLANELALKAGAAANGLSESQIKRKFNHDASSAAQFIAAHWSSFDLGRVLRVIAMQPQYVLNRYAATQPQRRDVGHLVMGVQYIVSEVVRHLSDRDFRKDIRPPFARRYPA
ncbi:hypothetical protein EN817_25200 [Mesorhizobium sp. M3A.F.Ca.ET.174.01.1.1]|uniref:hypothetical protein n=1 Tax=unclassified Mesorhizobium TaxID=325217 RepID=UPI001093C255|nr:MULTISPECIES: hypothetical protein [unclassified Mesorhizobium]TGS82741.1 hypothetical protein EN818_25250 [Mesorhizobium sp. M3A.F.Ca.ET.175.01.1.1]TGT22696.1 hypothetical protein EN817_25200 [Mesorhizobium sp. M3A.F.Ca.ET.174.01.1.1]